MAEPIVQDTEFNAMTSRLLRREALRRAAEELNGMSAPGLEVILARISAEATKEAAEQRLTAAMEAGTKGNACIHQRSK